MTTPKQPYERPSLTRHGKLEDLTHGSTTNGANDGGQSLSLPVSSN